MGAMFKIGEFAKLCGTSVKTLHFYDDIGLLRPAHVDKQTGYRFYAAEQMPRLARILTLKELGFSLDEIGPLVQQPLPAGALIPLLRQKQLEIAARLQAEQERFHQITNRLHELEQTDLGEPNKQAATAHSTVQIKAVPEQTVAALFLQLPAEGEPSAFTKLFQNGFATVYRVLGESQLWPTGAPLIYWKQSEPNVAGHEGDAAVCVPIMPSKSDGLGESASARAAGVAPIVLPFVPHMAYRVHHGSLTELATVFQEIFDALQAQSLQICGPRRDVVLHYGGAPNTASAAVSASTARAAAPSSVCEIQFPVSKEGKEP